MSAREHRSTLLRILEALARLHPINWLNSAILLGIVGIALEIVSIAFKSRVFFWLGVAVGGVLLLPTLVWLAVSIPVILIADWRSRDKTK